MLRSPVFGRPVGTRLALPRLLFVTVPSVSVDVWIAAVVDALRLATPVHGLQAMAVAPSLCNFCAPTTLCCRLESCRWVCEPLASVAGLQSLIASCALSVQVACCSVVNLCCVCCVSPGRHFSFCCFFGNPLVRVTGMLSELAAAMQFSVVAYCTARPKISVTQLRRAVR